MTCHNCRSDCRKFGRHRNGLQRFRCDQCRKTFTEPHERPLDEMRLPLEKAEDIIAMLVEGIGIRSIERLTGVHRDTIMRLLLLAGERCEHLSSEKIRNVPVRDVEVDEIWGFIGKKEAHKRPKEEANAGLGDCYTFVAIERHTKLVLAWHLGRRTKIGAYQLMYKLRLATFGERYQLTTDGFRPYIDAVENVLPRKIAFAQLTKVYAMPVGEEQRYSQPEVVDVIPTPIQANPHPARICTSHVERQNLTMRMQIKRLARLTLCFSKKWGNLRAALALHFAWYNFCRIHRSLRVTPAMEAGIADHVWTLRELLS